MPENTLTEDELHAALFTNMAQHEELTRALISLQLRALLPVFLSHVDQRAKALKDAIAAAEKPEKALAELADQVTEAEGECSRWSDRLGSDDINARIAARAAFTEWDLQLSALCKRRDWCEQELAELQHAQSVAQDKADAALGGLTNLLHDIENPFQGLGQGCPGYVRFRMLQLEPVILQHGPEHPEFDCAVTQLEQLASCIGKKLVDDNEPTAKLWDSYRDSKREQQTLQPSGTDVTSATLATIERALADAKANERIEDLRGHRTLQNATRRPDPSMDYQRLRDIQTSRR